MRKHLIWLSLTVLLLSAGRLHADSESGNWPFVATATTDGTQWHGRYYAKCVPGGLLGTDGVTRVYRVEKEQDVLVHTYEWYSSHIYLSELNRKVSVVRFGPWNRGRQASSDDLALALYYDGKFLKSYSTLDIAGRPDNVKTSFSHYWWYKRVIGYGHNVSPPSVNLIYGFSVETLDGRTLCFDVTTGELLKGARRVSSISTSSSSTNVVINYAE